jgi:hypothetical protein
MSLRLCAFLGVVALFGSPAAGAADYLYCPTTHTYYPAAKNCAAPWVKLSVLGPSFAAIAPPAAMIERAAPCQVSDTSVRMLTPSQCTAAVAQFQADLAAKRKSEAAAEKKRRAQVAARAPAPDPTPAPKASPAPAPSPAVRTADDAPAATAEARETSDNQAGAAAEQEVASDDTRDGGEDLTDDVLAAALSMVASESTLTKAGNVYNIEVVVDLVQAFGKLSTMQSMKFINPELNRTFFQIHQHAFMLKVSELATTMALISVYKRDHVGDVNVRAYYAENDDFGHYSRHQIYSLRFTKALNDKINWDGFDETKLPNVAKSFQADPQFDVAMRSEALR